MTEDEDPFRRDARAAFGFLERDFGFLPVEEPDLNSSHPSLFTSARWDSPMLTVGVMREKGEVDVQLVARIDTPVLRPYVSHTFSLLRVLPQLAPGCLRGIEWPKDERAFLARLAGLLRRHGGELLRGDLRALETLSRGGAPPRRRPDRGQA